jgi:hypothetical protein
MGNAGFDVAPPSPPRPTTQQEIEARFLHDYEMHHRRDFKLMGNPGYSPAPPTKRLSVIGYPPEPGLVEQTAHSKTYDFRMTNAELAASMDKTLLGYTPEGRPLYLQGTKDKLDLVDGYLKHALRPRRLTLGEKIERELDTAVAVWRACYSRNRV